MILLSTIVTISNDSLDRLSSFVDHALDLICCGWCSFTHIISIWNNLFVTLGFVVLARVRISLELAVFLDECRDVLNRPRAGVGDGSVFGASWEQLDGREPLNFIGNIVQGSVDFSDGDLLVEVGVRGVKGGKFLIFRSKATTRLACLSCPTFGGLDLRFTVAAPRCIKFQKNILIFFHDVLVVVGHNDGDRTLLSFRNWF